MTPTPLIGVMRKMELPHPSGFKKKGREGVEGRDWNWGRETSIASLVWARSPGPSE